MSPSIRSTILNTLQQVAVEQGASLPENIGDDLVLLESGLDSIGYAILVVELEQQLGFDPFLLATEPIYPTTLGEFVNIYERYMPTK
jgi:acyl carrier protein